MAMIADWIAQSYEARSPVVSSRVTQNLYFESTEGEGKTQAILVGTPGTKTFTREQGTVSAIQFISGTGGSPNIVTVQTAGNHNLSAGQLIDIEGTTNYNELSVVVLQVQSPNQFTYQTISNSLNVVNNGGNVKPTNESPITDIAEDSSCRGLYTSSTGRVFTCFGNSIIEIFRDGTWNVLITIGTGSTSVYFADDGFYLVFVDGSQMYRMNLDTNFIENITNTLDFINPIKVVYLNSRIVAINSDETNRNNNKFYWCESFDTSDWRALNFASAESSADAIISIEVREGELWLFGPRSYEVWRPDTNPDLPYAKVGGSSTEIGCNAPKSTTQIAGQIFWLGSSTAGTNMIFTSNGYSATRISNHAIEYFLNTQGFTTSDAIGFAYQQSGHTFYILNLIQANKTFVYDLSNGKWHTRTTRDALVNTQGRWEPLYATFGFDTVLVGSLNNSRLLELDLDRYTEWDGRPIVRTQQGPILFDDLALIFHKEFQIDMATGVGQQLGEPYQSGIQSGYASDPVIIMQHSDDGGNTWSSQRTTPIGRAGKYNTRARFRRLGRSRERVYRIVISDPIKVTIQGARILGSKGGNP